LTPKRKIYFLKLWSAIAVLAILCITGLEVSAMWLGVDTPRVRLADTLLACLASAVLGKMIP